MQPAREKWWDTCVKRYKAPMYASESAAKKANETVKGNIATTEASIKRQFIWGDRVRLIGGSTLADTVVHVSARGTTGWMKSSNLGGKALLELYVIDVGQGDGLLLVSPEGHHIMVDGGNRRGSQNSKKNAADFVDWKFYDDYLEAKDRKKPEKARVTLDAMIASHNDIDHFGGLYDLLDFKKKSNDIELDCSEVRVNKIYHAGLSWWYDGKTRSGDKKRSLGVKEGGYYTQLLDDRESALSGTKKIVRGGKPDKKTLNGYWGSFIKTATQTLKVADDTPSEIERINTESHSWLPGFEYDNPDSDVSIRVLGPVGKKVAGKLGLKKFSGDSINTNGHSIILRVDYGERRLMLTGDLNTESQDNLIKRFGEGFVKEFECDVAKGCHHGSADVSYQFLDGMSPVATVISSGDTENYDHPRANIMTTSALTGRKLLSNDKKTLIAPLLFITELSRSYKLGSVRELHQYNDTQKAYSFNKPLGDQIHSTAAQKKKFRAFNAKSTSASKNSQWPRLDQVKTVTGLTYGLINVRTDGKNLFFAAKEEKGEDWAISVLTKSQIDKAQ